MKNPIIGITLDFEINSGYSKFPWYAIRENYLTCLHKFGAIPFPLFHENSLNNYFIEALDGLVITGGNFDIDPQLYSKFSNGSRNIKDKRTNYEIDIFHKFLETSKPILGICGGEQLMNVASGGDLIQDINHSIKTKIEHEQSNPRDQVSHEVIIKKDSKLHTIINKESIQVNSAHHQSVDNLGKNFVSAAIAADGVIEAIEHTHHRWCLGLQWHPEFLITNDDMAIIKDFVDHAK
ncbi:MAG: gamma-glutamyl-gamma-aminobutyrate hydrolase family protein [Pelagibacteraceae bacterium]|nr:gamma-glutamyl-gamma-aminobutyrate hydrolase family protein [Pelagibacteraceae bacterium]